MNKNKLIAKFMGLQIYKSKDQPGVKPNKIPYDTSWDWLMPVVEKINTMDNYKFTVIIDYGYCYIKQCEDGETTFMCKCYSEDNTRKAVYYTVVYFIEWYNKNK